MLFKDAWKNLEPSEDWDNEEYTGSLADTKVFTPSTILEGSSAAEEPKMQDQLPTIQAINMKKDELQKSGDVAMMQQQQQSVQQPMLNLPAMHMSQQPNAATGGTLTAAQSQYLSQFTQPSGDNMKGTGQQTFSATLSSQVSLFLCVFLPITIMELSSISKQILICSRRDKRSNAREFHQRRRSRRAPLRCRATPLTALASSTCSSVLWSSAATRARWTAPRLKSTTRATSSRQWTWLPR